MATNNALEKSPNLSFRDGDGKTITFTEEMCKLSGLLSEMWDKFQPGQVIDLRGEMLFIE